VRFRAFWAMSLGIALSACATDILKKGMTPYMGQPASALFSKLGFPTRQDEVAGTKIYVWTTGGMYKGSSVDCTFRVMVDAQDIITRWDVQGNACEMFALRL
jgi:hypothetical protein